MRTVGSALDPLSKAAQARALAYMVDKYVGPRQAEPVWQAAQHLRVPRCASCSHRLDDDDFEDAFCTHLAILREQDYTVQRVIRELNRGDSPAWCPLRKAVAGTRPHPGGED